MRRKSSFDLKLEQLTGEAISQSLLTIERIFQSKWGWKEPQAPKDRTP